jgi:hypothetical protein
LINGNCTQKEETATGASVNDQREQAKDLNLIFIVPSTIVSVVQKSHKAIPIYRYIYTVLDVIYALKSVPEVSNFDHLSGY